MNKGKTFIVKNRNFYIAPFSAMSKTFLNQLTLENSNFLGFIDANKIGKDIYKIEDVKTKNYDTIYIISAHAVEIYKYYIKIGIKRDKIRFVEYKNELFYSSNYILYYLKTKKVQFQNNIFKYFMTNLKKPFEDNKTVLLLGIDFIDLNIKDLYIYLAKNTDLNPIIATSNKEQIKQFRQSGFSVISSLSLIFYYYSLKSKVKILDNSPLKQEILISFINSKVVQIWHGIPLKKIGHLANYKSTKYDVVVSTSDFVTDYSFSKLFIADKFLNSGYPRNDIFLKNRFEKNDLVLTNKEIFSFIENLDKKIFVYMPTWRPVESIQNPINLDDLNSFAKENNILIVIKNHPFTREGSFHKIVIDANRYCYKTNYKENILFFPTTDDIYPILSISYSLITDYSSVYFDYLLLDKPIIFFIYDFEEYIKNHGEFMLDFDKYTVGEKPKTFEELKASILSSIREDNLKDSRKKLKEQLFENTTQESSKILYKEIVNLLG